MLGLYGCVRVGLVRLGGEGVVDSKNAFLEMEGGRKDPQRILRYGVRQIRRMAGYNLRKCDFKILSRKEFKARLDMRSLYSRGGALCKTFDDFVVSQNWTFIICLHLFFSSLIYSKLSLRLTAMSVTR